MIPCLCVSSLVYLLALAYTLQRHISTNCEIGPLVRSEASFIGLRLSFLALR